MKSPQIKDQREQDGGRRERKIKVEMMGENRITERSNKQRVDERKRDRWKEQRRGQRTDGEKQKEKGQF